MKYNLTRFLNKPSVSGGDDDEPEPHHTPGAVRLSVSLLSVLLRFTNYTPCFNANLDRQGSVRSAYSQHRLSGASL